MRKNIILFAIAGASLLPIGCEDILDVQPYSELSSDIKFTGSGVKSVLFSAYRGFQNSTSTRWYINNGEVTTDVAFNSAGTEFLTMSQLINFTWDASLGTFRADFWDPAYRCIRDANIVIDALPAVTDLSEAAKAQYEAEARLLRAISYEQLYRWFGPVPLRTSSAPSTNYDLPRAADDEMKSFIETEIVATIPNLPGPGDAKDAAGENLQYGRLNKGVAYAVLAKYYLNTKQWQKAADAAQSLMDFNYYQLFPDFTTLFNVANEPQTNANNKEMILVIPCLNIANWGNWWAAGALPPNFKTSSQIPAYVWQPGMANFATQYRLRTAFVNTFDFTNDKRSVLVIRSYTTTNGANVDLMTTPDNARSLKYWDNATSGNHSGNDFPVLRYADILLTRAEALNELHGPTQEALDLINMVRTRAGLGDLILPDAPDQNMLRTLILRERGWEFVSEGKRREDLLRNGTFVSGAVARGITVAAEKHKLFPIPQYEIDANKLCDQNDGY